MVHLNSYVGGDKGFHYFPKVFSPIVNMVAQLDCKFVHYYTSVQNVSKYVTGTPHDMLSGLPKPALVQSS